LLYLLNYLYDTRSSGGGVCDAEKKEKSALVLWC
jgi:hypothetical protein